MSLYFLTVGNAVYRCKEFDGCLVVCEIMDANDPDTILTEVQQSEDEDGLVYYTILKNEPDENDSFTLQNEDDYLDTNNVFYLLNNENVEDTSEIQEDPIAETEDSNINMEFLEQVTLPDGTQAYMTRDTPSEENLFEQTDDTFELENSSTMLLQSMTEDLEGDITLQTNSDEEDGNLEMDESNLDNKVLFTSSMDDEIDANNYEQIKLEDGSIAMIEIGLYNKILEQSKKKTVKTEKESIPSTSNTKHQCPTEGCEKTYTTLHHLRVHMRNHTGTRPYECDVEGCYKTFATGYSLKAHSRTHTGEKPYACQSCEKRFKTSGDLQKHNRIHTGEKPFVCTIDGCGRSFTTSNIRKVHIRSHTGERPYECPEPGCNKAFASATNYKNHIRIHSGEKPYSCSIENCGKRFTEYSSLYKHQLVHTNAKSCRCEYCGRTCRHPASLIAHKRSVHNIIVTDNGTEIMVKMVDNGEEEEIVPDAEDIDTQIFFVSQ